MVTHISMRQTQFSYFDQALVPQGVLAFTFFDPRDDDFWADCKLPSGAYAHWGVIVDEQLYLEPGNELRQQERWGKPGEGYCSPFTEDYLTSLFPGATVRPAVDPECQHVCILRGPRSFRARP
jgi:hypothetical protein